MTTPQLSTSPTNPTDSPPCRKCGAGTVLAQIEPDKAGHDQRTFRCPACGTETTVVVKY